MPQKLISSPVNLSYRGFPWHTKGGSWGLILTPSLPPPPPLFFLPYALSNIQPFTTSQQWNEFGSVGLIKITPSVIFKWLPLYTADIKRRRRWWDKLNLREKFPVGREPVSKPPASQPSKSRTLYVTACWAQCDTDLMSLMYRPHVCVYRCNLNIWY